MKKRNKCKIIIADDHEIVRAGVKFILAPHENFTVVSEASSFAELTLILADNTCDILILDLNLGDRNGIPAIHDINKSYPSLNILVISMFPDDPYAIQSVQAGAIGYINKKKTSKELLNALDTIIDGKVYLNEEYTDTLLYGTELKKDTKPSIETLSNREFEVYKMITSGISYKDIAEQLNLSPKTISTYRTRILEKLSLQNINQLIHFSIQNSLGNSE